MSDPRQRRIRWITLAELLAIVAVVISALTFWNGYRERTNAEVQRGADNRDAARRAVILVLKATADAQGHLLSLTPRSDAQAIQGQTIAFPSALGLASAETTSDARIERGWFEGALIRARKDAGAADKTPGDAHMPVLIVTRYLADGDPHVDRAVYQLGYATDHSFIGGTSVRLRGLSREEAVTSEAAGQKRVDALWKTALPHAAEK
ncbi:hypothetical protein [Sphingomonas nostoxanthinifaciens]|uniref:hypothetical protein n=1 Tax=Sphingomonas nostoxanthinifaciens TaxID=2872652 RepID=UPI001CC1E277|nr:hypothetical protein [Sphingomonas nostoxanthinifaciens]UAK25165.1 hypothetical protein K8P63_02880 [Sphingomonas nostoxanthinifaciens]